MHVRRCASAWQGCAPPGPRFLTPAARSPSTIRRCRCRRRAAARATRCSSSGALHAHAPLMTAVGSFMGRNWRGGSQISRREHRPRHRPPSPPPRNASSAWSTLAVAPSPPPVRLSATWRLSRPPLQMRRGPTRQWALRATARRSPRARTRSLSSSMRARAPPPTARTTPRPRPPSRSSPPSWEALTPWCDSLSASESAAFTRSTSCDGLAVWV